MNSPKPTAYYLALFAILFSLLLSSCSSNKDVVSSSVIQKRKYNSGFYANRSKKSTTLAENNQRKKSNENKDGKTGIKNESSATPKSYLAQTKVLNAKEDDSFTASADDSFIPIAPKNAFLISEDYFQMSELELFDEDEDTFRYANLVAEESIFFGYLKYIPFVGYIFGVFSVIKAIIALSYKEQLTPSNLRKARIALYTSVVYLFVFGAIYIAMAAFILPFILF